MMKTLHRLSTGDFLNVWVITMALALSMALPSAPAGAAATGEYDLPSDADWVDYGLVFRAGLPGQWDHLLWGGFANSIIKKDGIYYLYYQGSEYYREDFDPTVMWRGIGVATSSDGIRFKKYRGNPILTWFPNKNGEEGAVSSGVALAEDGAIVLYYGANTQESATTVNANARLAVSQDGLHFEDKGVVLDRTNPAVWGSGDEIFPVGAIHHEGRWIVYYIPNGVAQSGQLGVAYGDRVDSLNQTSPVTSDTRPVAIWGTTAQVKIGENSYAFMLNHLRDNRTEVRLVSPDQPAQFSQPVVTYQLEKEQQAVLLLDEEKRTWFMYYQDPLGYGVKLAPAGPKDLSPPSAPRGVIAYQVGNERLHLLWQPAQDLDTGIVQYRVYRNGKLLTTLMNTHYTVSGSVARIPYNYRVSAVNLHGIEGPKSAPMRIIKFACCDR